MGDTPVDSCLFWEKDKEEEEEVIAAGGVIIGEDKLLFIRSWCWYWLCGCTNDDNKDNNYDNNNEDNCLL